ncbi:hypothetical protein CBL_10361 [Carabus blaptoides fortunei]
MRVRDKKYMKNLRCRFREKKPSQQLVRRTKDDNRIQEQNGRLSFEEHHVTNKFYPTILTYSPCIVNPFLSDRRAISWKMDEYLLCFGTVNLQLLSMARITTANTTRTGNHYTGIDISGKHGVSDQQ